VGRTAVTLTGEAVSAQTVSQNDVYHDTFARLFLHSSWMEATVFFAR
jgi:hypothetical protein